jgi:hypothetical protein
LTNAVALAQRPSLGHILAIGPKVFYIRKFLEIIPHQDPQYLAYPSLPFAFSFPSVFDIEAVYIHDPGG